MKIKTYCAIIGAIPFTVIFEFVDRYLYSDWNFARAIVTLIAIDTVASVIKHLINHDASSEGFWRGTSKKVFAYAMLLMTANIINTYTLQGARIGTTSWVGDYICIAMVLREVISIIENTNAIYPWLPLSALKRLKDFTDKGEYIGGNRNGES